MKKLNLLLMAAATAVSANAADLNGLKIYVNPGHGGYDSDDRNVAIPPFAQHDENGFWESKSNLVKGLALRDLLESFGTHVDMSRTTNTTDDDRNLEEIGEEANKCQADFFFSIHSNATGTSNRTNQPLMLYRGYTDDPVFPEAKEMSGILNKWLLENQIASWSSKNPWLAGDWTFYDWGTSGLGVLRKLTVPGMLSEGSYHDYIPETYRLMSSEYCWLEAYHFVQAIMEYFGASEKFTTGVIGGSLMDSRLIRTDPIYGTTFYEHDQALPIMNATVSLVNDKGETIETYTTQDLPNGVYMFKSVAPGNYKVKFTHPEYRDKEIDVVVEANKVTYENVYMDRIRNTPPEVVEYSPVWNEGDDAVLCNTPVILKFNWDMDPESVEENFSITPAVEGDLTWEDSYATLVFKPKRAYDVNTLYTVVLKKEAKHPENISMTEDFVLKFKTTDYNEMHILAACPGKDEKVHYDGAKIHFRFDKHPYTLSIDDEIIVTDAQGTELARNSRTRKVSKPTDEFGYYQVDLTKDLIPGATYTVNVSGELKDQYGIKIAGPQTYQFVAVDAAEEYADFAQVNSLDDNNVLTADAEASAGTTAVAAARNTATKLEGTASCKLTYTFSATEGGAAVYGFATAPERKFTNIDALGVKVYGDVSNNVLYANFATEGAEVKVKVCDLSYIGWHSCAVALSELEAGKEYTLKGFEIAQAGGQISKTGTVYVDNIAVGDAGSSVNDIEISGLRMYPNPASELLVVNADSFIAGIELYSLDGKLMAKTSGNVVNVSELPSGNYVAKIYTNAGFATKKVVVRH